LCAMFSQFTIHKAGLAPGCFSCTLTGQKKGEFNV
jgi:hypothetical protein